jgi:uncharacterized protein (DUF111 family)
LIAGLDRSYGNTSNRIRIRSNSIIPEVAASAAQYCFSDEHASCAVGASQAMARVVQANSLVDKGIDVVGKHASPFGGGSGEAQTDCAHGSFPHIVPADKPPSLEHVPVQFGGPLNGENGTPLSAQVPARISILSGG